ADAVIDHGDVEPAPALHGTLDHGLALGRLGGVEMDGEGMAAGGDDLGRRLLHLRHAARAADDLGAGLGEPLRHRPPEPAPRAADHGREAREIECRCRHSATPTFSPSSTASSAVRGVSASPITRSSPAKSVSSASSGATRSWPWLNT